MARGTQSGLDTQQVLLITSQPEWQKFWSSYSTPFVPPPALPQVDFAASAVVAVALGEQNTGGYAVEIAGVRQEGERLSVTVKVTRPAPGGFTIQALTHPYHMVRIPKTPVAEVTVLWQ